MSEEDKEKDTDRKPLEVKPGRKPLEVKPGGIEAGTTRIATAMNEKEEDT